MEEKVLYNVLSQISRREPITAAPDSAYIKALATIGLIDHDWDTTLTNFGRSTLENLRYKIEKW